MHDLFSSSFSSSKLSEDAIYMPSLLLPMLQLITCSLEFLLEMEQVQSGHSKDLFELLSAQSKNVIIE